MFVNKDSVVINGVNMGQYLTKVKYQHPKLWGSDSGRNLAGKMIGTLVGIFPKFTLSFKKLTASQMATIAPILDSDYQSFTYFDPTLNRSITIQTYTGDWEYENDHTVNGNRKNDSFDCSFIAVEKRGA